MQEVLNLHARLENLHHHTRTNVSAPALRVPCSGLDSSAVSETEVKGKCRYTVQNFESDGLLFYRNIRYVRVGTSIRTSRWSGYPSPY